jgi:hypothetical protein
LSVRRAFAVVLDGETQRRQIFVAAVEFPIAACPSFPKMGGVSSAQSGWDATAV